VDPEGSESRVGRDGALSLRFARRDGATVLDGCRFTLPLQVLTPLAVDGTASVVSILNPTGAVLGGDRLRIDVVVGPSAHAVLTTPSATRIHRTDGAVAEQDVDLRVAAGGVLEWVPDHTIPHEGSAFRQRVRARVGPGATLVFVDAFAVGRVARGECWRFAHLESGITVTDDAGRLCHDRFVLKGDGRWGGLGYTEGAPYVATIVVIADVALDDLAAGLEARLGAIDGVRAGVARLPRRGLLVRCLAGSAPALGDALREGWEIARQQALGESAIDLRKS